ncbi:Tm-1-like ATP-binding domain-containing protein [Enterococcus rotai]|uniref:Tm-1-like ATP-binding domain-containing protein n=1 Tax=Enterococcus rotai TaxID=118060 RepID=UPI0032B46202
MNKRTVAIAGTFDSKSEEFLFIKEQIEKTGLNTYLIHTGIFSPAFKPDVTNQQIAEAAGANITEIASNRDRAQGTKVIAKGLEILLPKLYSEGKFDGIISAGGSGGTSMVTPSMRALPIGVPKLMISTVAAGDVSGYVGSSDIFMYPSIVDVAGINSISKKIFTNAANAISGMVTNLSTEQVSEKKVIAASMFGVTTPSVEVSRRLLEDHGYEVLVFHATGAGGKSMEKLITDGHITGVLDLTTTEWCDELFGGNMPGGEHRLEAAATTGIPQVVSLGALDMVNFGAVDTIPEKYQDRLFYQHNPMVTLMRTTAEENQRLGETIAEKLNQVTGKTILMLPLKGLSSLDSKDNEFYAPAIDQVLFDTLNANINNPLVEIISLNYNINDPQFATAAAENLTQLMNTQNNYI